VSADHLPGPDGEKFLPAWVVGWATLVSLVVGATPAYASTTPADVVEKTLKARGADPAMPSATPA
jgi:hypothetical protein